MSDESGKIIVAEPAKKENEPSSPQEFMIKELGPEASSVAAAERAKLAEVMPQSPKEAGGEKAGEQGGAGAVGTKSQENTQAQTQAKQFQFTVPESRQELTSKIHEKLSSQLKQLNSEVKKTKGGVFRKMDPKELTGIMARIRSIKKTLTDLANMTLEALKKLYRSLFEPKGL